MLPGGAGTGEMRARARGTVGEILVAAVIFATVMGVTWLTHGRDGPLAGVFLSGASAGDDTGESAGPSDAGSVVSYGPDGELIRDTPATTVLVDPETGEEVAVTVPSSTTTVPGAPGTASTVPPTTAPGTSTPTTEPTTTTSTTEPTTTTSTTEPTTTTSTTEPTTTTTAPGDPPG